MLKMKDNLLSIIKEAAKEFKPKVEERTGTKLEDIRIEKYSRENVGEFFISWANLETKFIMLPPNKILLTEAMINRLPNTVLKSDGKLRLRYYTLHELHHLALFKINNEFDWRIYRKNPELTIINTLAEGFVCYMGLDGSPFLYNKFTKQEIGAFKDRQLNIWEECHELDKTRHYPGYMLAKRIVNELREEELFRLVKTLDITLEEIYAPGLYIERRKNEIR